VYDPQRQTGGLVPRLHLLGAALAGVEVVHRLDGLAERAGRKDEPELRRDRRALKRHDCSLSSVVSRRLIRTPPTLWPVRGFNPEELSGVVQGRVARLHRMRGMTDTLSIGQRVRWYRVRRGLSQEALAGLVGRTVDGLSKAERDVIPLDRLPVIKSLADALDVSLGDLLAEPSLVD